VDKIASSDDSDARASSLSLARARDARRVGAGRRARANGAPANGASAGDMVDASKSGDCARA
jgi:hypothetical protein